MNTKEHLIAAKALIDTPEKWGKGNGYISPSDCFCAVTALDRVTVDISDFRQALRALEIGLPRKWRGKAAFEYNDDRSTTHAHIMALFDRAIAAQDVPA